MKRIICLLLIIGFQSLPVFAESSGSREILSIGCHKYDNTCYMLISGDPVGPEECRSRSVRWNSKDDANGQAILTLASSAFYANRKVNFNVSSSCYVNQPTFPTFAYLTVVK